MKYKKITILIPCHNEEKGIGKVLDEIPFIHLLKLGYITQVIVIDNNSTDNTLKIAKEKNVHIIREKKLGKGNAIKAGMREISSDTDYVVMMDGDHSYKAKEIPRMVEPLVSNFCDVVIGSRLGGKLKKGSLRFSNRVANWAFTFVVRQFYRANITDVLSGYFAWKRSTVVDLLPHLRADGFAIEMEMITKMVKLKHEIYSVPITYSPRVGESKIDSLADGLKIFYTFLLNLAWKPDKPTIRRTKFKINESY
jgi:glycosyltransferase involved in cell wall biosynthesis